MCNGWIAGSQSNKEEEKALGYANLLFVDNIKYIVVRQSHLPTLQAAWPKNYFVNSWATFCLTTFSWASYSWATFSWASFSWTTFSWATYSWATWGRPPGKKYANAQKKFECLFLLKPWYLTAWLNGKISIKFIFGLLLIQYVNIPHTPHPTSFWVFPILEFFWYRTYLNEFLVFEIFRIYNWHHCNNWNIVVIKKLHRVDPPKPGIPLLWATL